MSSHAPRNFHAFAILLFLTGLGSAQTIIDDDFDAPAVSGWVSQGNTRTISDHNITQAGSILSSEVVATQTNTNRGIVSETSFEPAATGGFTLTFVVESVSTQPGANGCFLGLVRESDVFHRDSSTRNFGLAFFGQDPRTGSAGGFGIIYGDNNGSGSSDFQLANSDSQGDVDPESFRDGFTATISTDLEGWSYEITGLLDAAGSETTFTDTGTWADAGTDFASLWPEGQPWYVTGALQVPAATTHTVAYDRITLLGTQAGAKPQLTITYDAEGDEFAISWDSMSGMLYNLRSTTDPSSGQPGDWEIFDGNSDLNATPPTNTLTISLPADPERYFVVEEFPPPPVSIFSDDFESGQGNWTTGSDEDPGSDWELGMPSNVGPATTNSGTVCFGTDLDASYETMANVWLRSPPIDFSGASGGTLTYAEFRDIEPMFDSGTINILDASDDSLIAELETGIDGTSSQWSSVSHALPAEALDRIIKIEFRLQSDDFSNFAGWYIDDVVVTVPGG